MQCPIDQTELKIADRQGIEIDYCPQCRGVWLDRGELDKIIDRAATMLPTPPQRGEPGYGPGAERPPYHADPRYQAPGGYRWDDDDDDDRRRYGYRQRRGWLGEIFDFD
jgi:uncharacterized protein